MVLETNFLFLVAFGQCRDTLKDFNKIIYFFNLLVQIYVCYPLLCFLGENIDTIDIQVHFDIVDCISTSFRITWLVFDETGYFLVKINVVQL